MHIHLEKFCTGILDSRTVFTPLKKGKNRCGFTLIEMLTVIAIMSILMTAAGPVLDRLTSSQSPSMVAGAVAGQLERARRHAFSKNSSVWVRLGAVAEEPNDFYVGVFESLDGTNNAATATGVWTAPRFPNYNLSNGVDPTLARPSISATNRPDRAAWLRFTPSGEVWLIAGDPTQSRIKMVPPTTPGTLIPWIEIGLQPTARGQIPNSLKKDVAAIQLSGLTGQTLQFSR